MNVRVPVKRSNGKEVKQSGVKELVEWGTLSTTLGTIGSLQISE